LGKAIGKEMANPMPWNPKREVDQHATEVACKMRLVAELRKRGEDLWGTEGITCLCRTAEAHGFNPEPFLDRDKIIYWN
jgi:hypothetical protein